MTRISYEFEKQSHAVSLIVGFTVDDDSEPTTTETVLQSSGNRVSIPVNRICVGISPYLRSVGNDHPLELLRIEIDFVELMGRPRQ